jgi:capsular polysaccharide biosynthesis protein
MPDLLYLLRKRWKQIIGIVFVSLLFATLIVFLQPRKYLSESTALRASSYTTDKARVFSKNIEELYSTLGSADDLDMIIGTAQLDTVYLAMTDAFNLVAHYNINGKPEIVRQKAGDRLKKDSRVKKSGFGELKVMVWDKDKKRAAELANGIMDKLQSIHQQLLNESNFSTLSGLRSGAGKIQAAIDSLAVIQPAAGETNSDKSSRLALLEKQRLQYEELIGEYQLMVETKQPALLIVEKARPGIKPDRPEPLSILVTTALLSLLFALLLVLLLEGLETRKAA